MKGDIYKKGLMLLAAIVIALITVFGYTISDNKDEVLLPTANENSMEKDNSDASSSQEVSEIENEELSTIVVDVNGAVKNPGIYELKEGMRVNDAIDAAGGLTDEVNDKYVSKHVNKARILNDEEKLYIPKIGDDVSSIEANNNQEDTQDVNIPKSKININTATKKQLVTLKGIGETFAQRIIDYRKNKKFSAIEDIKNVKGIGDKTFDSIKNYITVE